MEISFLCFQVEVIFFEPLQYPEHPLSVLLFILLFSQPGQIREDFVGFLDLLLLREFFHLQQVLPLIILSSGIRLMFSGFCLGLRLVRWS